MRELHRVLYVYTGVQESWCAVIVYRCTRELHRVLYVYTGVQGSYIGCCMCIQVYKGVT